MSKATAKLDVRLRPREYQEVRASDLRPHPKNPRIHPGAQREALRASLDQFGDVRSLLAYRSPQRWPGQLVLIDGHCRAELEPDRPVKVEVLTDLTDAEAEALLLTMDPLSGLADYDDAILDELRQTVETDSDALANLWGGLASADAQTKAALAEAEGQETTGPLSAGDGPEQWFVLIPCANEPEQTVLLEVLQGAAFTAFIKKLHRPQLAALARAGLKCEAKSS